MGSLLDRVRRVIGRERAGPLLGLFAGALLIVALPAQTAQASDLSYDGPGRTITYQADADEPNTLIVSKQQGANILIFEDAGTTINVPSDPLGICVGAGTDVVRCYNNTDGPPPATGPGFNLLIINLENLDDTVHNNTNIKSQIDGGTGNDEIWGGDNDDVIFGGDGDDEIHGGKGNDELHGDDGDDLIAGDDGDDIIFGGDADDDMSGNAGDDIIHTGLGTGDNPEKALGGDGDDVVFFEYDADPATVTISKNSIQEILVDTDDNDLRLTTVEELHIFNDTSPTGAGHAPGGSSDDYRIGDLTGRPLKVLVLQSDSEDDANLLNADALITAQGTSGDDKIVLHQFNEIGRTLPELSMGDGQGPWGKIVFRGPPSGEANSTFITVNALEGNDSFDVDLSLALGNEVGITLNGGSGVNTLNFSRPQNNEFTLDLSQTPDQPEAGVVIAGSALGDIAFTDVATVSLDGKGKNIDMTIITPEDTEDIVYTPGSQNGTGTVEVAPFPLDAQAADLITFKFQGVGDTGSLTFEDTDGVTDNLEYNGSSRNETFIVNDGADGEIDLTSSSKIASVKVFTPGVANLTINAGNGDDIIDLTHGAVHFDSVELNGEDGSDTFKIAGVQTATIVVNGGAPNAGSDVLTLTLPTNNGDIDVDLDEPDVHGYSTPDPIAFTGIEHLNLQGLGHNDLTVNGQPGDDEINYTPANATDGKIEPIKPKADDLKDINFTSITGDLVIDGGDGDNIIRTLGTSGADTIEIIADSPNSTTQVGSKKTLNTVNADTETLAVDSGAGKDTINFTADCTIPLHLLLDGNTPGGTPLSGDVLNVSAGGGAETKTFSGHDPSSGNIDVCTQKGGDVSSVEFERIERIDAGDAGGGDGLPGATQPDGVFPPFSDGNNDKKADSKSKGDNIYGAAGSGAGGRNTTSFSRASRINRTGGSVTIPFVIQNDGPNGPDSYHVVFASELVQRVSGNNADPGITVTVGGKNIGTNPNGAGGLVGPIEESNQLRADIKVSANGATPGNHTLIFNIFSDNGGGNISGNKSVDSVTVIFSVSK